MHKIVVILGDGMADYPDEQGLTPLMQADKPHIDALAKVSEVGLCRTVPEGMKPGSDTANLSVIGYDPKRYYTGRSPLEALSIGIALRDDDLTYRANLVTLSGAPTDKDTTMVDYSAGEISTAEAAELIGCLAEKLGLDGCLYTGVSYRHCLVVPHGKPAGELTPPHDITGKAVAPYLPQDRRLLDLTERAYALLRDHPVNVKRRNAGKHTADALWFWGEGKKPMLDPFREKFGLTGAVISAVDLLKGIGIGAGLDSIDIEGATGTLDTNYDGKAQAAIDALQNHDYVYIHLEGPDECGHQGDRSGKITAIERIDRRIVAPVKAALDAGGAPYRMLVIPDHATPLRLRTHVGDPVPYVLYDSEHAVEGVATYNEQTAAATGRTIPHGCDLIKRLIG